MSKKYQDYVFHDGRLIGEFEEMYKKSLDVPWKQDKINNNWYRQIVLNQLKSKSPYESILVIGSGLGYLCEQLFKNNLSENITGMDISSTAVKKAQIKFPQMTFFQGDIRKRSFLKNVTTLNYDLVVIVSVLWYVFDHLEDVMGNLLNSTNKYLYIYQDYYYPTVDYVGKDVITSHEDLVDLIKTKVSIINTMLLKDNELFPEGYYFSFLAKKT